MEAIQFNLKEQGCGTTFPTRSDAWAILHLLINYYAHKLTN